MVLPITPAYPVITQPVTVRAAAILLAAGAWDAAPLEIAVPGFEKGTFFFSYTRGAAGGAFDYSIEVSPYSADQLIVQSWYQMSEYAPGILAAGVDTQSRVQREYITYQAIGAAIENFISGPIEISRNIERIRLNVRESGDVANPGTVHIVATFAWGN